MLGAGMVITWLGYAISSYGWVLLRGWDIPFRAWVSPLNPYSWPQGGPGPIPDTQLFPGSAAGAQPAQQQPSGGSSGTPPKSGQGAPTGSTGSPVKPYG